MDTIAVLDMGGQYCHLEARRIRHLRVYSEILPSDTSAERLRHGQYRGIILSGGPGSVLDEEHPDVDASIFSLGIPILSLCYGHQLIAQHFKGRIKAGRLREYGSAELIADTSSRLFAGMDRKERVWMSHGDSVETLPEGFRIIGSTDDCRIAAMSDDSRGFYGLQFHPEVTHTTHGMKILENFAVRICRCRREWSMESYIDSTVDDIKQKVRGKNVFLLISGGVDSLVCYALLHRALPDERIYALHIDNGLMRKNESDEVRQALQKLGYTRFHVGNYQSLFFSELKEVYEPEEKRNRIGEAFITAFQKELQALGLNEQDWLLAQGTIYPDTIETGGTEHAATIKTHHNRVPLVQRMIKAGRVIEPLASLYKDEVRGLGKKLGLPARLVHRHPFPGPGLGVRCLCSAEEKSNFSVETNILPVQSVGVQGDSRSYRNPYLIQGMSIQSADWDRLERQSTKITNTMPGVNRVLLLLAPERVRTVSLRKAYITEERISLLQRADDAVARIMEQLQLSDSVWQFPVVLAPLSPDGREGETVILRPVCSTEAMTASFTRLPAEAIAAITRELEKLDGVDMVLYDITNKPPGTIEWE